MNQYQDSNIVSYATLKSRAKGALAGRLGQAVLAFFLVWLIGAAADLCVTFFSAFIWAMIATVREIILGDKTLELLYQIVGDTYYLNPYQLGLNITDSVLGIIPDILKSVFQVGLSFFCLNLVCNRPATLKNIFYGFQYQFGKSLKLAAVYTLVQEIYLLPGAVFLYLTQRSAPPLFSVVSLWITAAALLLSYCLSLPISQCFFLMLDFPEYNAGKLLRLSTQIMRGHKIRLFLLSLSFLPLFFLSMLAFGIGNLWLVPYRAVTMTYFFLNLMQAGNPEN